MNMRTMLLGTGAVFLGACRGAPPGASPVQQLVDSLRPSVETAAGMRFKSPPIVAVRSKEQVRAYLTAKLDAELPEARARGMETAYRLFGLLPDSVQLRPLLLDLLSEQVVGYYDADSAMLFGVAGSPRDQLRLVMAHEMVHALQGQYLPLDSILRDISSNDRRTAAQAILEGQATYASLAIYAPNADPARNDDFWAVYGDQVRDQQASMPVFARAPLVVREDLIFPYVAGAEFMHWWETKSGHAGEPPFGALMPASSEQVMHPDHYQRGDQPVAITIDSSGPALYEDVLGEMETDVLVAQLVGSDRPDELPALGWGGDRYRVIADPAGPVLLWYLVFDDDPARQRFVRTAGVKLERTGRPGYLSTVQQLNVDRRPAIRHILAPAPWRGWAAPPSAQVVPTTARR